MTRIEVEAEYQKALKEGKACRALSLMDTYYFLAPPPTLQFMELLAAAHREAREVRCGE